MSLKKATLINSVAKYYNVICAFIVNVILSRILTPSEYGVVAVATVFITFFSLFSDLGFGVAYIQSKILDKDDRDNLFTFLIYVGIALLALFFVFSYAIAWFYKDTVYIRVSQLLGINLLFTAVNVIPHSELLKLQRFKTVGITQAISSTLSSVCAVIFAYLGFSYYSIVLQSLIYTLILGIVFISITKTKFLIKIRFESVNKVLGFSVGQISFNFINYFSRNLDNLLIGKFFGNTALGYYDKAYKTSTYPVSNLSSIIGSSIQPVLSKHQNDKELVYDKFKKSFLFLIVIGAYLSIALSIAAPETILVLYGSQWENSIIPFSFLALSLFAQMSLNITGAFYQVLNNTRLLAFTGGVTAVLIVGGIFAGLFIGSIEAIAISYFIAQCINFIAVLTIMSKKLFQRKINDVVRELVKVFAVSTVTYLLSKLTFIYLIFDQLAVMLILKISVIALVYFILLYVTHLEKYVLKIFFPGYKR